MTFVASVIARDGVAIIADSLVTSLQHVISFEDFSKYIRKKEQASGNKIELELNELWELFRRKPTHTKDYEVKLFKYDDYTAITTAGSASINSKKIKDLVREIQSKHKKRGYSQKKVERKVNEFIKFLEQEVKEHIQKKDFIGETDFIWTYFDKKTGATSIFKINVLSSSKKHLTEKDHEYIRYTKASDWEKVVLDGQYRISKNVLLGPVDKLLGIFPKIVQSVLVDQKVSLSEDEFIKCMERVKDKIIDDDLKDIKMFKLTELSLQQAVDLAALLMNVEIDFQKYTEDVPTVGGVIRIAVIDEQGFRYISGDQIVMPKNI